MLITWATSHDGTHGQIFDPAGQKSGAEFKLSATGRDSITALPNGGFIVLVQNGE